MQSMAADNGLKCHLRTLSSTTACSATQEGLRDWRRTEGLAIARQHSSGGVIATAHHADDQDETILLKLLRGVHLSNLQGMAWRLECPGGVSFARPLLGCRKLELKEYLHELQPAQTWFEDSSNELPVYQRNRVRLKLMPLLHELTAGSISARLSQMSLLL